MDDSQQFTFRTDKRLIYYSLTVVFVHEKFLEKVLLNNLTIFKGGILCTLNKFGMFHFGECKVVHNRVVLGNHIAESRNHSERRPFKFIQEMIKLAIEFFLFVGFLEYSQLQFACDCIFEEKVYENVIVIII